jgi:hypothetical protein
MERKSSGKYDSAHDVMHLFFPPMEPSLDDEHYPGVIVRRSAVDDRIVGVVIGDYSKRRHEELKQQIPIIAYSALKKLPSRS